MNGVGLQHSVATSMWSTHHNWFNRLRAHKRIGSLQQLQFHLVQLLKRAMRLLLQQSAWRRMNGFGTLRQSRYGFQPSRTATSQRWASSTSIVDTNYVEQKIGAKESAKPKTLVLFCGKPASYSQLHIPKAVNFSEAMMGFKDPSSFGMINESAFKQIVRNLSLAKDTTVVFYDDQMNLNAVRAWWVFQHFGFPKSQLKVLNGGWKAWTAENKPTEKGKPTGLRGIANSLGIAQDSCVIVRTVSGWKTWLLSKRPKNCIIARTVGGWKAWLLSKRPKNCIIMRTVNQIKSKMNPNSGPPPLTCAMEDLFRPKPGVDLVDLKDLKSLVTSDTAQFVDARNPGEYQGGRIPRAIQFEWKDAVDPHNNDKFRSPQEIQQKLTAKGFQTTKASSGPVVAYCQRGMRGTYMAFVLQELLGLENVKLYENSMMEYSGQKDLPLEK